jgi:hypothetical protein
MRERLWHCSGSKKKIARGRAAATSQKTLRLHHDLDTADRLKRRKSVTGPGNELMQLKGEEARSRRLLLARAVAQLLLSKLTRR